MSEPTRRDSHSFEAESADRTLTLAMAAPRNSTIAGALAFDRIVFAITQVRPVLRRRKIWVLSKFAAALTQTLRFLDS